MSKQNVKNGTPVGNAHLCRNCSNGQFTVGYRETDILVVCTNSNPARAVSFPVRECTDFSDRNRPSWDQMEELAISFSEIRTKPVRGFAGFGAARVPAVDDDEEDEAALAR